MIVCVLLQLGVDRKVICMDNKQRGYTLASCNASIVQYLLCGCSVIFAAQEPSTYSTFLCQHLHDSKSGCVSVGGVSREEDYAVAIVDVHNMK